ncbi:MAG TPA: outer membrane beta-barrel protein [Cyclobacteriaceae bacterium]|nr:outer membrane beta-barrel protein [Cyclobacteriaceae bacterium]
MRKLLPLVLCLVVCSLTVYSQNNRKRKTSFNARSANNGFLDKQWWLGFKAGVNFSKAVVDQSYGVYSPANYEPAQINKTYDDWAGVGAHATVEITFTFKQFSLSLQPTYRNSKFSYANHYEWDDAGDPQLILDYKQEQKVDWAEFPLLFKYDITTSKLRPYVQAGAYYAFLVNANKSVQISGVDYASGSENKFTEPGIIVGASDLFAKNHWGLVFGAGVNYHVGNIRLNLDFMYRKGMSLINSTENRYGDPRLTGTGDVMDDIKLNNIAVSLGCLFPMRFLSSGFQSIDR